MYAQIIECKCFKGFIIRHINNSFHGQNISMHLQFLSLVHWLFQLIHMHMLMRWSWTLFCLKYWTNASHTGHSTYARILEIYQNIMFAMTQFNVIGEINAHCLVVIFGLLTTQTLTVLMVMTTSSMSSWRLKEWIDFQIPIWWRWRLCLIDILICL